MKPARRWHEKHALRIPALALLLSWLSAVVYDVATELSWTDGPFATVWCTQYTDRLCGRDDWNAPPSTCERAMHGACDVVFPVGPIAARWKEP